MRKLSIALVLAGAVTILGVAIARDGTSETRPEPRPARGDEPRRERISVYPAPGVRTASPRTQISFRGAPRGALGEIVVTGSRSGEHRGRLRAHSDGKGASFVPSRPFRSGERVTVRTRLEIAGARDGEFQIAIARRPPLPGIRDGEPPDKGRGAVRRFATRPDLIPPAVRVTTAKPGRAPGYVFLSPKGGRGHEGPMIIDDRGSLVWFKRMPRNRVAADFRAQTYRGKPVLTWWQGGLVVGDGRGYGVIYDQRYRRVATVRAGNGYSMDLHEFTITPQGTALITIFDRVRQDLRSLGGPRDAVVLAGIVQEIDIATGLVLFEWHSMGSVGLDEGKTPLPKHDGGQYDYFHLNSVALDGNGDFLISARNTWGVYKVDRETAKLRWRLGGTKPTFKMGKGTSMAWQHHARPLDDGNLLIYDNGSSPQVHETSRVLTVRVDERAKTARLVQARSHPRKLLAATQGGAEALPNGNVFVGWGSQRWFSEYDPEGRLVFDGQLARGNDSYRAFRMPWEGRPAEPPRAVATVSGGRVTARASWNGATEVARWQLLAGPSEDAMTPVADTRARWFETAVTAATGQPLVAMRALDADGETLGTSAPVTPQPV